MNSSFKATFPIDIWSFLNIMYAGNDNDKAHSANFRNYLNITEKKVQRDRRTGAETALTKGSVCCFFD